MGKFGLTGGFDMEYGLSGLWSLSAGVGYTQMGASDYSAHPVTSVLSSGNQNIQLLLEEKNGLRYSFDYVTVPVTDIKSLSTKGETVYEACYLQFTVLCSFFTSYLFATV